jgi:hypothetical protein
MLWPQISTSINEQSILIVAFARVSRSHYAGHPKACNLIRNCSLSFLHIQSTLSPSQEIPTL